MPRMNRRNISGSTTITQEELACYAASVFGPTDVVEVRRLPCGRSSWHQAGKLAEAAESLVQDNQHNQHIYVGANPRCVQGGTRGKDVACARCLFADFDGIGLDIVRDKRHNAGLPTPTLTIASGHGVHTYWRLAEPITDMALWSVLQKRLIALLGSDSAIHDPARIMRLPGFVNHKRPIAACRIIDDDRTIRYDLKYLMPLMYSKVMESDYTAQYQEAGNFTTQPHKRFYNNISAVKLAKLTAAKWPVAIKGGRNSKAFRNSAYLLKNLGLTEEQVLPILRKWNHSNTPPLPERELIRTLRNASIYGRQHVGRKVA